MTGWVADLPSLNLRRGGHGCSSYVTDGEMVRSVVHNNTIHCNCPQVLLVTGGLDPLGDTFSPVGEVWHDSTELLLPGAASWTLAGSLPRPTIYCPLAAVNNQIFLFGE